MEASVFKYCFENTYTTILNLFENYSDENTIEISFNELPDDLLKSGKFEDEYFGKILTSFAAFRFKIEHENVNNEFQIEADREIDISKIQHPRGFIKYSNITPISNKINFEDVFINILYVRKLSVSVNLFNWRLSKIIKITSAKKNHKKLIWNYNIEDVFNPKNYNQIYYKLEYYGYQKDITNSFIEVMNLIYPSKFRIFNRIWFDINKIIDVDSIEPSIKYFRAETYDSQSKYYKFKNQLSTIIEYKNEIYEIKNDMIKLKNSDFNGLRIFKCDNQKILSVLYNSNPEIEIKSFSYVNEIDDIDNYSKNYIEKHNNNTFTIHDIDEYITFSMKNGYLYLKGTKAEIISKDAITNKYSLRHNGYTLLDITIKQNEEKLILFYLPFNHKPISNTKERDGIVRCKLIGSEYKIVEYINKNAEDMITSYQEGLDIAIANYIHSENHSKEYFRNILDIDFNESTNQFIYEHFLNRIQDANIIYVLDYPSIINPEIIKRLIDINSIFLISDIRYYIGSFIKRVSSSVSTEVPQLLDINTKIYNKSNIDLSVVSLIENIFMFSNFTINSINVMLIFNKLNESFVASFKKLYKSILSEKSIIIFKNNEEMIKEFSDIFKVDEVIEYGNDVITVCRLL